MMDPVGFGDIDRAKARPTDGDPMRPRPVLDDGRGRTVRAERLMAIVSVHSATIAEGFVYLAVWAGWLALLAATSTAIMAVTSIVVAVLMGVAACITISEGDRGPGSARLTLASTLIIAMSAAVVWRSLWGCL